MFRMLRSLLGGRQDQGQPKAGRVVEITSDNRVIYDTDSIIDSPAAQAHIAAARELAIHIRQTSGR